MICRQRLHTLLAAPRRAFPTALLALCSCSAVSSPPGDGASTRPTLLEMRRAPGLEMRVLLSQDTIDARGPVEVWYFVVNGPTPTPFLNNPSLIGVWVETENGQHAPVSRSSSASPSPGDQAEMVLPAHGVLGQKENLRCVRNAGYAASGPDNLECVVAYQLNRPGRYHVIVRYTPPSEGRFAHPVIADTALLVVR